MTTGSRALILALISGLTACDSRPQHPVDAGLAPDSATPVDAAIDAGLSDSAVPTCGDGVVQAPETCDGDCSTTCDDGVACTADTRTGSADTCDVRCAIAPIDACTDADGCCAPGCNALNDSDCSASCGNGVVEGSETCDGDCPASCNDGVACTTDTLVGSASSCSASCSHAPISACTGGDGCCAPGCTGLTDSDCPIVPPATILINEVLYDGVGADAASVFIELYGPPGASLEHYRLVAVNGGDGGDYAAIPLSGTIPADGLFVVAHPSAAPSLSAQADLLHTSADLQNGPDSLQVRYGSAIVDALGYGTFGGAVVFAGEGTPALATPVGESLSRDALHTDTDDNAADFVSGAPSPGAVELCASALPPRLVYPLSAGRVTNGAVPFRWELPAGHEGAEVEVCSDRACTSIVASFSATGASGTPAMPLAAGSYYWRARGRCGAAISAETSPVWQLRVAPGTRAAHTSWGYTFDADADGRADGLIYEQEVLHVYRGSTAGLLETSDDAYVRLSEVEMAGDINGDGYGDALIGTSANAFLHLGGPGGLDAAPSATIPGGVIDFGALGDIDGDGYADVGIVRRNITGPYRLDIYRGGDPFSTTASQTIAVTAVGRVDAAGDVNGDGYADALVTNCGPSCRGDVFVYLGGPSGLADTAAWSFLSEDIVAAAGGGDINGDGYADVIVGDHTTVRAFWGGPSGLSTTANRSITDAGATFFGWSVAIVGDIDLDGYDDIAVGDPGTDTAFAYFGPSLAPAGEVTRGGNHDYGSLIVPAGDVNGDGRDDFLIGAPNAPMPATREYVHLMYGHDSGIGPVTSGRVQYLTGNVRARSFGSSMR